MDAELGKLLKEEWYVQGALGKPFFVMNISSVPHMREKLGYSYGAILGLFREGYCEYNYRIRDLRAMSERIMRLLQKNPSYLEEQRTRFRREQKKVEPIFKKAEANLKKLDASSLIKLLHKTSFAAKHAVGIAHLIESVSQRLESDARHQLMEQVSGKQLNECFSVLTAPVTPSFVAKKEQSLWKINQAPQKKKAGLAKKFIQKFYWFNSSYSGSKPWTVEAVLNEAKQMTAPKKQDFRAIAKKKEELFRKLKFSPMQQNRIRRIDFVTDWQDERKARILRAVYCLSRIIKEISFRTKKKEEWYHYFLTEELTEKNIFSPALEKKARLRMKGCVIADLPDGKLVFEVPDFGACQALLHKPYSEAETLYGTCASLGTATGAVRVCTTLKAIEGLQDGEILVASMTRPEYVPAMKKAAAIITDEGGITCHAAIISRELGKPCVIGTKIATRMLKDGWIVKVKASHGQVDVLEKKESK